MLDECAWGWEGMGPGGYRVNVRGSLVSDKAWG